MKKSCGRDVKKAIEFVDFNAEDLLHVVKGFALGLSDKKVPSVPMRLETLCVSVGMDQGDWSATWSKALEASLANKDNQCFKLEDIGLNLHPSQKHLLAGHVSVKQEPGSLPGTC